MAETEQSSRRAYVTLGGFPLFIELKYPFHKSGSGADFWVLHGDIRLGNSDGLHAPVAVNLTATVHEVLRSLEPHDTEGPVINTLRKEVDRRQLEFVKSGKLVPVNFSSRYYDFKRNKWVFGHATDADITQLLTRKVFWHTRLVGGNVWVGDPTEALYVESSVAKVLEIAREMAESGLMTIEGEWASANAALMAQTEKFEADMKFAQTELEKKHAFEDSRRAG
ncbi:MAG TPA: hypothetical protein VGU90_10345 [Terriglobales bacterium]|nr:hypothetical protein [Terriglobales bacterium]